MSATNGETTKTEAIDKGTPATPKKSRRSPGKKNNKDGKRRSEGNAEVKLKRFIQSVNEKKKRKLPMSEEEMKKMEKTKKRRKETNKTRRVLSKILIGLLEDGSLYTKDGKQYENIYNVVTIPDKKKYATIINNSQIRFCAYKENLQLADINCDIKTEREVDKQFKDLLKRYLQGDPEVVNMISTKKVITKIPADIDEQAIKEAASKMLESSAGTNGATEKNEEAALDELFKKESNSDSENSEEYIDSPEEEDE